jgi:hypothetical protein
MYSNTENLSLPKPMANKKSGFPYPIVINFVMFQCVWFTAVIGSTYASHWPGIIALAIFIALHAKTTHSFAADIRLAGAAIALGLVIETALIQSGLLNYVFNGPFAGVAPIWVLVLWANFALTMNGCLRWLQNRYVLAAVLGALGGPLTYLGGIKLGAAATEASILPLMLAIALIYALVTPALLGAAQALQKMPPREA